MSAPTPCEFQSTLVVRISHADIVIYANAAMATYLRSTKEMLIGSSLETLSLRVGGEISSCFLRYDVARPAHRTVTDAEGRIFEVRTYREGGVLDILLDEVTTPHAILQNLNSMSGVPVDSLSEDELRTARQPERRFLTVTLSRMDGTSDIAAHLPAGEAQIVMNVFSEGAADAVLANGGSVFPMSVDEVLGIHGAPRYFADHSLRALRSACAQKEHFSELRSEFHREGKQLPSVQCGIWSGEVFVGTFGSSSAMRYSAMGKAVEMAARLAKLARPGEVLLSEITFQSLRENLPPGWQAVRSENETPPDLADFQWSGEEICPLPDEQKNVVWSLGPGVEGDLSAAEFYLEYLWALAPTPGGEAVAVLRAVRPSSVGDSVQLQDDNIVHQAFEQVLGKYRLVKEIGFGGMGKVWKGMDRLGNTVAIKVLHTHETTSEAILKRFRREAEIMARLPHRHICRIFEMSEFEGMQFIVMEFVDGMTLGHLMRHYRDLPLECQRTASSDLRAIIQALRAREASGAEPEKRKPQNHQATSSTILPVEKTLSIMLKVCEAVQFAHEHGVLHRDLKPENILLREDGDPLVADFGLAKVHGEDAGQSLSVSGNVVGTLQNMAPEQAESSKDVDERADVYSLGTILYLMLTGKRHFKTDGNLVVDIQKLRGLAPIPLRKLNPALDQDLEIIVLKALRANPAERYRRVSALAADIARYRRGEAISARPVTFLHLARKAIRRHRAVASLAGVFFLVLLIGGVFSVWEISKRAIVAERALKALGAKEKERLSAQQSAEVAERKRQQSESSQDALNSKFKKALDEAKNTAGILKENSALKASLAKEIESAKRLQEELGSREKKIRDLEIVSSVSAGEAARVKAMMEDLTGKAARLTKPEASLAVDMAEAVVYTDLAEAYLKEKLEARELSRMNGRPLNVLERISEGLSLTSKALAKDFTYAPAWMLKGRYHLACMELESARRAFGMAAESPGRRSAEKKPFLPGMEDPQELIKMTSELQKTSEDRLALGASLLYNTDPRDNKVVGVILSWMKGKAGIRAAIKPGSTTNPRPISISERLVDFIADNGGSGKIAVVAETPTGAAETLSISGFSEISKLDSLKPLDPASLKVRGAEEIAWDAMSKLPLTSIDLEGSQISMIPESILYYKELETLVLKGNPVSSLEFIRHMPSIEKLDISGTKMTDLSPIQNSTSLRELDAAGLEIRTAGKFFPSSLKRVTITPSTVAPPVLKLLRETRTIAVLRAPADPPGQSASTFWQLWDAAQAPPEKPTAP